MEEGRIQASGCCSTEGGEEMIEGNRVLRKDIPMTKIFFESTQWNIITEGDGWSVETVAGIPELQWNGYIDLAGYTREERTWFSGTPWLQEGGNHSASGFTFFNRWDFITNSPIQNTKPMFDGAFYSVPSFIGSDEEPESVIWGMQRTLAPSLDTSQIITTDRNLFGMGAATATDRLYCYSRIPLNLGGPIGSSLIIPPAAFIVPGTVKGEEDLVYMERLRRSFELQQTPDVDV